MRTCLVLVALLLACACAQKPGPGPGPTSAPASAPVATGPRNLAVSPDNPHHARVEGTSFKNACTEDSGCHVGGCSSEVCSAEEGVITTCELPAEGWPVQGATCGCVDGGCVWWK